MFAVIIWIQRRTVVDMFMHLYLYISLPCYIEQQMTLICECVCVLPFSLLVQSFIKQKQRITKPLRIELEIIQGLVCLPPCLFLQARPLSVITHEKRERWDEKEVGSVNEIKKALSNLSSHNLLYFNIQIRSFHQTLKPCQSRSVCSND